MLLKSASQYSKFQKSSLKVSQLRSISTCVKNSGQRSVKKKKSKVIHKRSSSTMFDLTPLEGLQVRKAPKLYTNQIFSDIYDEQGNHDRVVDISGENTEFDYEDILPGLLLLPSMGRNSQNPKKIVF